METNDKSYQELEEEVKAYRQQNDEFRDKIQELETKQKELQGRMNGLPNYQDMRGWTTLEERNKELKKKLAEQAKRFHNAIHNNAISHDKIVHELKTKIKQLEKIIEDQSCPECGKFIPPNSIHNCTGLQDKWIRR